MNHLSLSEWTVRRRIFLSLAFGGLIFLLWLSFWNVSQFPSDEEELFYKGFAMAHGKVLYRDLISQHMPLSYQIAALFAVLGAQSVTSFRIAFYLFYGICAAVLFFRYAPRFGSWPVAISVILYLAVITGIDNGTVVLADQLEAIGLLFLFYELLLFLRDRRLTIVSCIFISLSASLAVLCSFAAVFPLFACFVGVVVLEIHDSFRRKESPSTCMLHLLKRYIPLILLMMVPFVFEAAYLAFTGTLRACFDEAYRFNIEVYSKYYPAGYGSSTLSSLFGGITKLAASFRFDKLTFGFLLDLGVLALAILFCVDLVKQNAHSGRWEAGAVIFYLIACATRGGFDYHGLPAVAVLCAMDALVLGSRRGRIRLWARKTHVRTATLILVVLASASPLLMHVPYLFSVTNRKTVRTDSLEWAVDTLTDPLEEIGFTSYDQDLLLDAGVLVATRYTGSTPWYWEWGRTDCMAQLEENPPRVYIYESSLDVWGYPITQYAPEIGNFISQHYKDFSDLGFPTLYVRNDCYTEAHALLDSSVLYGSTDEGEDIGPVSAGQTVEEAFHCPLTTDIANIEVRINALDNTRGLHLIAELTDENDGSEKILADEDTSSWTAGSVQNISFDPVTLQKDHTYHLVLTPSGEGSVTFARGEDTGTGAVGTVQNGRTEPWLISFRIVKAQNGVVMVVRK